MSLFGDLNLDDPSIPDDPNLIPDNTYEAFLFDVKPKESKKGQAGIIFTYKIAEGNFAGRTVGEWKSAAKDDEQGKAYLKQRLASLGVPVDQMSSVDADALIGTQVYITVKNNNGYANVNRVTLASGDASFSADAPTGAGMFGV